MIALDTNILARLLLADDPKQYARAVAMLKDGRTYTAPVTVMLELSWILITAGKERAEIANALRNLIAIPAFQPKESDALLRALHWYESGLDFADALHLALSAKDEALSTFDEKFAKRAKREKAAPPVTLC
jgi:predicted nucleic acid-binding protein